MVNVGGTRSASSSVWLRVGGVRDFRKEEIVCGVKTHLQGMIFDCSEKQENEFLPPIVKC